MTVTARIRTTFADAGPLYAAVGVGDLAAERLRRLQAGGPGGTPPEDRAGSGPGAAQHRHRASGREPRVRPGPDQRNRPGL